MDQEQQFLRVLENVSAYEVGEAGMVYLVDADHKKLIKLSKK